MHTNPQYTCIAIVHPLPRISVAACLTCFPNHANLTVDNGRRDTAMRTWTWRRTYSSTGLHSEVGASDTCRKRASTSFMVFRPYFEVFAAYPGVPETALRLGPGLHLPGVAVEVARLPRGQRPISEPYHTHHAQLTSLHVNLHDLSIYFSAPVF